MFYDIRRNNCFLNANKVDFLSNLDETKLIMRSLVQVGMSRTKQETRKKHVSVG